MNMSPDDFGAIVGTVEKTIVPRFTSQDRENICELFRKGESLKSIANGYLQKKDEPGIMITAIRLILMEELKDEYKDLSHGKGGKKQKGEKIGIHSHSAEQKSKNGSQGAIAIGREPYSVEEIEEIKKLAGLAENIKGIQRFHADKIADALHQKFPGKPKRTSKAISNYLSLHVKSKKAAE